MQRTREVGAVGKGIRITTVGLLIAGLVGALGQPARTAAAQAVQLRYQFRRGSIFTVRIAADSTLTEVIGRKATSTSVQSTGLEQGTVARIFPDGSALFRFRFADLSYVSQGKRHMFSDGDVSATQWVPDDGIAEAVSAQCLPFDTTAEGVETQPPLPLADHPVAIGDSWSVVTAQPGLNEVGRETMVVRLTGLQTGVGTFSLQDGGPVREIARDQTITGTTALSETVRQDVTSGALRSLHGTFTGAVTQTLLDTIDGRPEPATVHMRITMDAEAVPDAEFPRSGNVATGTATPTPTASGTPTTGAPRGTTALRALNLTPSDVPACYAVYKDHVWAGAQALARGDILPWPQQGPGLLYQDDMDFREDGAGNEIDSHLLRFSDSQRAHAYYERIAKLPHVLVAPVVDLTGPPLGEERIATRPTGGGAQMGVAAVDLVFRRGPYVEVLELYSSEGAFATADGLTFGHLVDYRLQAALAAGGAT